jgi:hypothetical protein
MTDPVEPKKADGLFWGIVAGVIFLALLFLVAYGF